jgi:hypothetical protein
MGAHPARNSKTYAADRKTGVRGMAYPPSRRWRRRVNAGGGGGMALSRAWRWRINITARNA